jgi:malate dehydrogenase
MAEAIVKDKKRILPCSAWLEGEFGIKGVYLGVPCKIGARGLEQIIEIEMNPAEHAALVKSADAVRETLELVKL